MPNTGALGEGHTAPKHNSYLKSDSNKIKSVSSHITEDIASCVVINFSKWQEICSWFLSQQKLIQNHRIRWNQNIPKLQNSCGKKQKI